MTLPAQAKAILDTWFGDIDASGQVAPELSARWFSKSAEFDEYLRQRFASLIPVAMDGQCDSCLMIPQGRLALIILLDQFSRNVFRDTPQMFAADAVCQALVADGMALGHDQTLCSVQLPFFYMPLMHAEDLVLQDQLLAIAEQLLATAKPNDIARLSNFQHFAKLHRDIIARFGRFPHRNVLLGRESSVEEVAFLKEPNSSF